MQFGWLTFWRRGRRKFSGIEFRVMHGHHSGRRFLLIHGDESTAREVLAKFIKSAHGTALLIENEKRNVPFKAGKLDPNRMFSREGADRNLRRLNPDWNEAQIQSGLIVLDRQRHQLAGAVRPHDGDVLIAVHNNGPGYSVNDEIPIADQVALNDAANPHEFCLCTDPRDFEKLRGGSYNVVLQNRTPKEDDGSLSRLAAKQGWRYVNIEAGLGRAGKQRAMLEWLNAALPHSLAG